MRESGGAPLLVRCRRLDTVVVAANARMLTGDRAMMCGAQMALYTYHSFDRRADSFCLDAELPAFFKVRARAHGLRA